MNLPMLLFSQVKIPLLSLWILFSDDHNGLKYCTYLLSASYVNLSTSLVTLK